ncbi:hypothetical protein ACLOJK_035418 [Asimina triloba]
MAGLTEMDGREHSLQTVKVLKRDIKFVPPMEESVEDMQTDINSMPPAEEGVDGMRKVVNSIIPMEEGDIRRSSTGGAMRGALLTPPRGEEKLVPHYLQASAGSCHDFCKYGRKHEFEAKERRPFSRKVMRDTKVENECEAENHGESKKKPIVKSKTTPEVKTESSNKSKITIRKGSSSPKDGDVSDKHVIALKLTTIAVNSPDGATKSSSKADITNQKSASPAKKSEMSDKYITALKLKPTAARSPPSSSSKNLSARKKSIDSTIDSSGSINSRRNSEKSDCSGGLTVRRNKEGNMLSQSLSREKKATKPSILSLTPRASLKRISSLNRTKYRSAKVESTAVNQNKLKKSESDTEKVKEKTLHAVKPKPEIRTTKILRQRSRNGLLHSSSSSSAPSKDLLLSSVEGSKGRKSVLSRAYSSISKRADSEKKKLVEISKSIGKRMLRRTPSVRSEVKESVPEKLQFRRGKVLNVEPENNAPRRLKFRKVRSLRDNSKGEVGRRSFRRKREFGNDDKPESHTIKLKHRDVQREKGEKRLFNDVIEETANKLVETRKSKVKALVGAFETVISLQERKPVAAITTTPTT